MVLLLGGMVLYLHLVACLIWQALHVLSSARGVFEGIELLQKNRRVWKTGRACDYLPKKFFLTPPPLSMKCKGCISFAFLCLFSCFLLCGMVLLKCVELKQQRFICRVCAFILFVVGGSACFLIMRYRANSSSSCLLVVHIRQRARFCSCVLLFHIERYYFSCVVMVLLKCVELKYIAFNSVLYRCRWFSLILCFLLHYNALESK